MGVLADLALRDHAALVRVHDLDRVLDRHDVAGLVLVVVVDQGGERRRLARARRARHQEQALALDDDVLHRRRQTELLDRADVRRDDADDRRHGVVRVEEVDAEARQARHGEARVDLQALLELALLVGGEHRVHQLDHRLVRQGRAAGHRHDAAVDHEHRRQVGLDVHVGGAVGDRLGHDRRQRRAVDLLLELDCVHAQPPTNDRRRWRRRPPRPQVGPAAWPWPPRARPSPRAARSRPRRSS